MKKSTNTLRLAILAALAGGSSLAYAQFPASPVASEMPTSTLTSGHAKVWSATTGFSPTAANPLQITVNLSGNSKFVGTPGAVCTNTGTSGAANTRGIAAAWAAGKRSGAIRLSLSLGGNGSTQAVFSTTTAVTGQFKGCWVSATAVQVTGTHAAVTESITFKYGTLASSTTNGSLITWNSGVSAKAGSTKTVTARVSSGFLKLTGGSTLVSANNLSWKAKAAASASTAKIGAKANMTTYINATSAAITFAGTPLAAAKSVGGVYVIATGSTCSTANKLAGTSAKAGASSVSFTISPTQASAGVIGCFSYSGTTVIPAGSITAQFSGHAKTNYSLPSPAASTVITVAHDGTSLVAPLVNVPAGWISRLVLNNRSSAAADYTVTATSETGTVATLTGAAASGSIAANSTSVIDLSTLLTTTGNARTSLYIAIAGTNANIDGLYQLVNAATGNLSNYTLINKQ